MSAYHFINSDQCRPQGSEPYDHCILPFLTIEVSNMNWRCGSTRNVPRFATPTKRKVSALAKDVFTDFVERRPVDPPPIIRLRIKNAGLDPCKYVAFSVSLTSMEKLLTEPASLCL